MEPIAVAMSGGVDSSVAAWLLQQEGYRPAGVTMRLFSPQQLSPDCRESCNALKDLDDAQKVAQKLGIPHHAVDLSGPFCREVMDPFVRAYEQGRTPNPCVLCNRAIKFGALLDWAVDHGYPLLATGHYARIERDSTGRYLLKKADDPGKDQSYVLWSLTQEQLSRVRYFWK